MSKILEKLSYVPDKPGVYVMRDAVDHVIYIGKAKNLPNRLGSYFKSGSHDTKVTAMLQRVADFDYFVCKTEKDALGLEANLIKKHKPHYNILLKDSKIFPYLRLVPGDYPYLEITRKLNQSGKYFGPYFNGIWAKELLSVVQDVFGIRQCVNMAKQPCLNYQMEKCPAPCAKKISHKDYAQIIENVKSFLRGERDHGAREILTKKMENAANLNQFEIAIRYRNGIAFLDKLKERTITQVGRDVNCDVFANVTRADIFVVAVLTVRAGKIIGIQNFADENKGIETQDEMLQSFIRQYYLKNIAPDEVVTTAEKGYKKKLLEMAEENAREYLDTSIEKIKFKTEFTLGACRELGNVLSMPTIPKKIECYDISHMGGEDTVASMVVFVDGVAEKKLYRKFKIKHGLGNNDFMSMREVLTRRLKRLDTNDDSFGIKPDLIIVDGGKPQLSAALEATASLIRDIRARIESSSVCKNNETESKPTIADLIESIGLCALAKREEEIFLPHKPDPIVLSKRSYALRLLQRIRDEAHRFAIGYQKNLRARSGLHQPKSKSDKPNTRKNHLHGTQ